MHSAVAHLLLSRMQPNAEQWLPPSSSLLSMCGMSLWPAEASCPALSPLSCSSPPSSRVGQHEKLWSPWLSINTALQQLEHWCAVSMIFILNPKHKIQATMEKIHSIPAKTRIFLCADFRVALPAHLVNSSWCSSYDLLAAAKPSVSMGPGFANKCPYNLKVFLQKASGEHFVAIELAFL